MSDIHSKRGTELALPWNIKVVWMTPDLAKTLLQNSDGNRRLRSARVDLYAKNMRARSWGMPPDCIICVASDGRLLNGRHRLNAVVQADLSVKMQIAYDVDPETFRFMDRGASRSAEDLFGITRDQANVARRLILVARNDTSPLYEEVNHVARKISDSLAYLTDGASHCTKIFASSPIRAAAIIRLVNPKSSQSEREYVKEAYYNLITSNHSKWVGAISSLADFVQTRTWENSTNVGRIACTVIAYYAFNPKLSEKGIKLGMIRRDIVRDEMRELIAPLFVK